jgi:hypothetical protein
MNVVYRKRATRLGSFCKIWFCKCIYFFEVNKIGFENESIALMGAASCGGGVRQHRYSAQQD